MKKVISLVLFTISVFVYNFAMAAGGSAPVTVNNIPLPITGNVGIMGTPSVNVINPSIPITGNIEISNAESKPVPVKGTINVNDPATRAVRYYCYNACVLDSLCKCTIADIPVGQRLAIDAVSAFAAIPRGQKIIRSGIMAKLRGDTADQSNFFIRLTLDDDNHPVNDTYSAAVGIRLYADDVGDTPEFWVRRNDFTGEMYINIDVFGYLVDMP